MKNALICLSLASLLLAAGPVSAQQDQQPAPGTPVKPTDVQNIGDWTVRCFPVKSLSPCDMYEQLNQKGTQRVVLAVSIAYVPSADRHALQIVVPLGVSIAKGAVIKTSNFTSTTLPFRRCDPQGCYVEMIIDNDSIDSLAKSDPEAHVDIVADDGKPFSIRLSLQGFSAAHDAMATLSKQKATAQNGNAPAAATASAKKK